MPVTRDSPSTQGDVPGPDPARAPPNKAIARAGLACRGSRRGSPCQPRSATRSAAAPRAGRTWSTSGPHTTGTERFATVSSGYLVRAGRGAILGKRARRRTLIRMRSQVQVLAGPPAKALSERPPATPLDHLGPLGPAPAPTASVLAPPVQPPRGPHGGRTSRLGRLPQDRSALPSAGAAGRVSPGRGPGWLIGRLHQTGPGLASQAQRRRRRNARTARSTQPTSTTVTKTTQIGSSGGIAQPLTKWS